ncbi:MAG: hypothetical protein MJ225_04820 [Bacilli bacterium]|nr:hypothetical protein [Bacilli bacterium]
MSKYYGGYSDKELYKDLIYYIENWHDKLDIWGDNKDLNYDYNVMLDVVNELIWRLENKN